MTSRLGPNALDPAQAGLPPQLASVMRPELPDLAAEIIAEVRAAIPEYSRPMDGPYGDALRDGVQQALTTFVDLVADPSASRDARDNICRLLGRYEALEGRSLDSLQAAYRLGGQVAWRRVIRLGERGGISPTVMPVLADALFSYLDELAALSLEGYQEATVQSGAALPNLHRRLVRLILEQPPAPRRAIAELAELARWQIPELVTPVAVRTPSPRPRAQGRGRARRVNEVDVTRLDDDVLADLTGAEPRLLVPGKVNETRELMLETAVAGRIAVGVTVPLPIAADSMRWARGALSLAESAAITGARVIRCEDHLVTLLLLADPVLADQIVRRQLGLLERLTPLQRSRYTETLGAWLETRCTATEIAQMLHLHPQTIRYRIRQFEQAFGDRLKDPDARFGLELALRVMRLGQRVPRRGGGKRPGDQRETLQD